MWVGLGLSSTLKPVINSWIAFAVRKRTYFSVSKQNLPYEMAKQILIAVTSGQITAEQQLRNYRTLEHTVERTNYRTNAPTTDLTSYPTTGRTNYRVRRTVCHTITHPWGGFPCSIGRQPRGCQIPNDTSSESSRRDVSKPTCLAPGALPAAEISSTKNYSS